MPPLVASFGYFLSIQEIPPPEAPGDDDKQCRQNVERERSGASPRKALALKRRTRPVVAFTPKHCTNRQESAPREVQRGLWLWRAGARRSMPPLVASFGYFLSTQEIPPPEAPGSDDKQCRENVTKKERIVVDTLLFCGIISFFRGGGCRPCRKTASAPHPPRSG